MRVCPLCKKEYEDSIEFCFSDGSPLDPLEAESPLESTLEEELGFRGDESMEFLPPEATGLTGEFEAASGEATEEEDALEDRDSGIEVVPGGLTSPLDDESMDELVTDPFSGPRTKTDPLALARPDVDEGAATLPAPPSGAEPPPVDDIGIGGTDEDLSLDRTVDEPAAADAPAGEAVAHGFESGSETEVLDEPPAGEAAPTEAEAETETEAETEAETETEPEAEAEPEDEDEDAMVAPVTPAPPMGVTAQGPVSAKEGYVDPLYASIPPGERGQRRSKAIWLFGALVALLLVVVAGWAVKGQLDKRGQREPTPGPVVEVDRSDEDRAPNPDHRPPPADNGHADATPEDEDSGDQEEGEPTPGEPEIEEEPPAVEAPIDEEMSPEERRREEEAREQRRKDREERRKVREERQRLEREAQEREDAAAAAASDDDGGDPWATGTPGSTVAPPADPANPWATGTPGNASGQLTISSTPVGAAFTIDGQSRGSTPLTVTVDYGVHVLRVEKDGYVSQERRVDVNAGRLFQDFSLKPVAAKGKLTVFTHPEAGATLFVDGVQRGSTPVTIEISPGVHTLRVVLDGFPVREETIDLSDLQPGEVRRRTIDMQ
jgi:hypothetical protein